jgi:hypothetical protein
MDRRHRVPPPGGCADRPVVFSPYVADLTSGLINPVSFVGVRSPRSPLSKRPAVHLQKPYCTIALDLTAEQLSPAEVVLDLAVSAQVGGSWSIQ